MLEIRDLVKIYPGGLVALRGIDLTVESGLFGLLGPNGAGKSTLMKILATLLEPTSGTVRLDGIDVLRDPHQARCRLGYLPQEFGFTPQMTARSVLRYLLSLKGVVDQGRSLDRIADQLLETVNLREAADRPVGTFSSGMRQRLGIAQAVAGSPGLLIVDEPTAGLDPEERIRFYNILAELGENRVVLLSTHIVEDVSVLCRRFAVISGGRILMETTPQKAREAIEGKIFEGRADVARLAEIRAAFAVTTAYLREGAYHVRIYSEGGSLPQDFVPVAPSLEDAYHVTLRLQVKA